MSDLLSRICQFLAGWFAPAPEPEPIPYPSPAPDPEPQPEPEPRPAPVAPTPESSVIEQINAARESAGLSALARDESLMRLAASWAASMASSSDMDHGDFADRISSVYPNTEAAENIAEGQPDADSVVAAWLDDPPHRANMLGDFNRLGVGVGRDDSGSPYWCADFVQAG